MGQRAALTAGRGPFVQTVGAPPVLRTPAQGFNAQQASAERQAIPAANLEAYKKTIARTGEYVHMLGSMLGSSAVRVMRESIQPVDTAASGRPADRSSALGGSGTTPTIRRARTSFPDTRTDRTSN